MEKILAAEGKVLLIGPNKVLKFSDFNPNSGEEDVKPNYAIVEYESVPLKGGETKLQVTDDYENNEKKYKESHRFWREVLPKLKQVLEKY